MEENKANIPQPPVAGYQPPYGYYPPEDEINLVELWNVLVRRKNIIFILAGITTIGAVLYAMLAAPIYKAEVTLLPPASSDIQVLNISGFDTFSPVASDLQGLNAPGSLLISSGFHTVSIDSVYATFEQNLGARASRLAVFEKMNLLDQFGSERGQESNINKSFDTFNQSLTVKRSRQTIILSMEGGDPELIADIINKVAEEAERATAAEIILGIEAKISASTGDLKQKIKLLREIAKKQRLDEIERLEAADALERKLIEGKMALLRNKIRNERLDRIARLQEAAKIARSLDIADPVGNIENINGSSLIKSQIPTEISNEVQPLYTRGYEALEAELKSLSNRIVDDPFIAELRGLEETLIFLENNQKVEQLKTRSNDDPFIAPLRDKEYELAWLESISIDPATVKTARLDQAAFPPDERIKPKRKLIVVLGLMLGLMLGVFVAFFVNFLERQREDQAVA